MQTIQRRLDDILNAARLVADADRPLRLYLRVEPEVEKLGYFAKPFDLPQGVGLVEDKNAEADVALFTQHGLDVAPAIWAWRQAHPGRLVLLWAWDNHLGPLFNLHSALSADIVFPSHAYAASNLLNPIALLGPHLPPCCAQWQGDWQEPPARKNRLMAHYVDYPWAQRSKLLGELASESDWADVRRMAPEDKRAYFGQTPQQRLQEWLEHKVSLIVPVDRDLSTRFFDALYAGQVPLLAGDLPDLDAVTSIEERQRLGVVHVQDMSLEAVQEGYRQALSLFDAMGDAGVQARHRHAVRHHMLNQRIASALGCAVDFARGKGFQAQFNVAPAASGLRLMAV
jgi:hypothetical protein